jgi:hypothetical protein
LFQLLLKLADPPLKFGNALVVTVAHMSVAQPGLQERNAVPKPGYDDLFVVLMLSENFVRFFRRVYGSAIVPSSIIHGKYPFQVGVRAGVGSCTFRPARYRGIKES